MDSTTLQARHDAITAGEPVDPPARPERDRPPTADLARTAGYAVGLFIGGREFLTVPGTAHGWSPLHASEHEAFVWAAWWTDRCPLVFHPDGRVTVHDDELECRWVERVGSYFRVSEPPARVHCDAHTADRPVPDPGHLETSRCYGIRPA